MRKSILIAGILLIIGAIAFIYFNPEVPEITIPKIGHSFNYTEYSQEHPYESFNYTQYKIDNPTPEEEPYVSIPYHACYEVKNYTTEYRYVKNGTVVCGYFDDMNVTCLSDYDKIVTIKHCNIGSGYVCAKNITYTDACTFCSLNPHENFYEGKC